MYPPKSDSHQNFSSRSSEFIGDFTVWARQHADDNSDQLQRLKRCLPVACQQQLSPRQAQVLQLYFGEGLTMTAIAQELEVNVSTVSRTIKRAKFRLHRSLRYLL